VSDTSSPRKFGGLHSLFQRTLLKVPQSEDLANFAGTST
jgi:hypothetical protein